MVGWMEFGLFSQGNFSAGTHLVYNKIKQALIRETLYLVQNPMCCWRQIWNSNSTDISVRSKEIHLVIFFAIDIVCSEIYNGFLAT